MQRQFDDKRHTKFVEKGYKMLITRLDSLKFAPKCWKWLETARNGRFCFQHGLPEPSGPRAENTDAPGWLMDPYDHILPILRERVTHMPYQYLESFKTIFWEILSACTLNEAVARRPSSPPPHAERAAREQGGGRAYHVTV